MLHRRAAPCAVARAAGRRVYDEHGIRISVEICSVLGKTTAVMVNQPRPLHPPFTSRFVALGVVLCDLPRVWIGGDLVLM